MARGERKEVREGNVGERGVLSGDGVSHAAKTQFNYPKTPDAPTNAPVSGPSWEFYSMRSDQRGDLQPLPWAAPTDPLARVSHRNAPALAS